MIVDVNHDGLPDVIVTNYSSADVSVLLGRGDGTFQPQRRFDATSAPTTLGVGDFNGDGQTDLVAVDSPVSGLVTVSSLLGRGDGTFQPQKMLQFQSGSGSFLSTVRLADFNKDGRLDLVIAGLNGANGVPQIRTFLGNGDGTFTPGVTLNDADMFNTTITAGDVNGDGNPDIVAATFYSGEANVFLGHGDGTFQAPQTFFAGQVPTSVTIADLGSQVTLPDGTVTLGPPDGHPDLVITNGGSIFSDLRLPSLVILPGLFDSQGKYQGFGIPLPLSSADTPLDLVIGDLNGDGTKDVAFVDRDGIRITFGKPPVIPPNDTPQTARNLGTVVHVVEPTLTIVPGHEDAYYTLTAPTEAARSPGPEVLDVSGLFQDVAGPGLALELRDAATGVLLGSGPRFRAVVAQGQVLSLHVFGASGADGARGAGAYTLDLDVLPQLVSVEAQPPLPGQGGQPGGPTSSLVLTFQGDRLDPATAQDPAHYRVTWLGPDGRPDTADDQVIPISSIAGSQSVVYDPSANVDVASGKQYPTAVHQTVTLLFAGSLPTGSYRVELSPAILTAPFNEEEQDLLADESQFAGHPVVFLTQGQVEAGSRWEASGLVAPAGNLGDFRAWEVGTPFLTQLHDDLGALLDAGLTNQGDSDGTAITAALNRQIQGRFISGLSVPGRRPVAVLVIWLDPVSFALADPGGSRITYDLQTDAFDVRIPAAYVNVTGNIEVVAIPVDLDRGTAPGWTYVSDVSDVPARARGGAVYFGPGQDRLEFWELTDSLRTGQRTFDFVLSYAGEDPPGAGPGDHPASPPLPGPGGHTTNPEPHQAPTQPGGSGFNPPALSLSSVTIVTVLSSGGQEGSATASVNSTGQAPVPTRLASGPKDTPRIQPPVASQGAAGANGISGSIPGRPASPDLQLETLRRAAADALGRIVRLFARRSHVLRFLGSLWPISRVVWRDLAKWVLSLRLGADERSAPARPGVFETPNPEPIEGGDGLLWRDGGRPEMQPRVSPPGGIQALFAIALLVAGVGPGRVCDRPPCGRCRPGPRE